MGEWWATIGGFEKVFWFCAIPASAVLLIQMVLTFMGLDGAGEADVDGGIDIDIDGDGDADIGIDTDPDGDNDHSHDGFPLFTFRNFVAFFTVFGWTGITMLRNGYGTGLTLVVSLLVGIFMMFLISLLFYGMSKLASSGGTYSLQQAVGKEGTVYVRVPKKKGGHGKVNVELNSQMRELDALNESGEDLVAGTVIKVSKIINNKLVVERA